MTEAQQHARYTVDVALVGERSGPPPGSISPSEFRKQWDEREKVALQVAPSESLLGILRRASAELCEPFQPLEPFPDFSGEFFEPLFVAFDEQPESTPLEERMTPDLAIVDEEGRARWGAQFEDVTFADLLTASEAGTIEGDPFRIFLIRRFPQAGGVPIDWDLLVNALEVGWRVLEASATAYTAVDAFNRLRQRLRGREALESVVPDWIRRDVTPERIARLLGTKTWESRKLAALLGCTSDEAEGLLEIYGFERNPESGYWENAAGDPANGVPEQDSSARLLVGFLREVGFSWSDSEVDESALERLFRDGLARMDAGEVGPFKTELLIARHRALDEAEEHALGFEQSVLPPVVGESWLEDPEPEGYDPDAVFLVLPFVVSVAALGAIMGGSFGLVLYALGAGAWSIAVGVAIALSLIASFRLRRFRQLLIAGAYRLLGLGRG